VKFVVDAQLPPALAAWLRDKGHDAVAVREIGLRHADDGDIWSYARAENAIVVTKDEDFGLLAATAPDARVLWVRIGNTVNRVLLARMERAWPEILARLEEGEQVLELR
jgi:predicted nuclease of predicted toxin-antitoxin system